MNSFESSTVEGTMSWTLSGGSRTLNGLETEGCICKETQQELIVRFHVTFGSIVCGLEKWECLQS